MDPEAKRRRVASRVLVAAGLLLLLGNGACAVGWKLGLSGNYEGLGWSILGMLTLPAAVLASLVALVLAARRGLRSPATLWLVASLGTLAVAFGFLSLGGAREDLLVPLWGAGAVLAALVVASAWRR